MSKRYQFSQNSSASKDQPASGSKAKDHSPNLSDNLASVQSYAIQTGSASNSGGQDASPQVNNADAKREQSFSLSQGSSPTKVRREASSQYEQLRTAYEQEKAAIDWKYQQQMEAL